MSFDSDLHDSFGKSQNDPKALDEIQDELHKHRGKPYVDSFKDLDKLLKDENE